MQKNQIWFNNIDEIAKPKSTDFEIFQQIVASSIKANRFNPENLLIQDDSPRIIFLSIALFPVNATIFHGEGQGLLAAFEHVFSKMQKRFNCSIPEYIIKLDIVKSVKIHKNYNHYSKYILIPGLEGIAFPKEFDLAILPEEISCNSLLNADGQMVHNRIYNYLEKNPSETLKFANLERSKSFDAYIFQTDGFLFENNQLTPLFRGQRLYETVSQQELKYALQIAGYYLTNAIIPCGRYDYQYHVDTNFSAKDYNFLRHAGTSFSLAEYLEFSKDQRCLPALKSALAYMKLFALPGLEDASTICFAERGLVKVGGNGLAALALAKYIKVTGDDSDKDLLSKICNWILTQTQEDGNFIGHKQLYHDGSYNGISCLYYPGEVIYGLTLSYNLFKESTDFKPSAEINQWLQAANNIAHWMIQVRDKGVPELKLEHDHWLLYGLNELYRISPHSIYLEHAIKTCKAIMNSQFLISEYPDYIGAHNNNKNNPSSTQSATRSEGLLAAYKLLRDFGNVPDFAAQILEYAQRSISFQLRTQYTPLKTIYVHNILKTLGGFRGSINSHEIRIDYVQHNISSLISLYRIMER